MSTLCIFDLDDVLIHEGFEQPVLCDDTIKILQLLKENSILIALATYNEDAIQILITLNILQYFDYIAAWEDDNSKKVEHITKILQHFTNETKLDNIYFFDDLQENIDAVSIKFPFISSHIVDYQQGIDITTIETLINNNIK